MKNRVTITEISVRVFSANMQYCVKKGNSRLSGCSFMMIQLDDVNGKEMSLDIWSSESGSFE